MELTLKRLLEHAEFKKYRGKGYDPAEVDDFLDRAAAMAGKVEVQLTQALEKARAADAGEGPDPAAVEAEIERRVAERVAQSPGGPSEDETAAMAQRTLLMAQRTADAAVREAREDADKLLSSATEQAETLVADAEARAAAIGAECDERAAAINAECDEREAASKAEVEAEATRERREARQRLAHEIAELEGIRETLRSDVSVLERHVEEQRSQLGSTLAELQQILDDPSGFRLAPEPPLADPTLPDFSDLAEPEPEVAPAAAAVAEPQASEPEPDADPEPEAQAEAEPEAEAELESEVAEDPAPMSPQPMTFDEVDHEAPGLEDAGADDPVDSGPPTAPVTAVDLGFSTESKAIPSSDEEDPFLTELRKAMADEEPLGPRDDDHLPQSEALFEDDDRRGWRFGRRR